MAIAISILFPLLCGLAMPAVDKLNKRGVRLGITVAMEAIQTAFTLWLVFAEESATNSLTFAKGLSIGFASDMTAKFFCLLVSVAWLLVTIYACVYMKHEKNEGRFFLFSFLTQGAMMGSILSSNLVSMYLFFEMVTLFSAPLVLHSLSKESIAAAKKYLYYSIGGAFLALFGIFVLAVNAPTLVFHPAGNMTEASPLVLTGVLCMCIGFGAKAGLFPLHGWLPTAHPVAPAPASALLSGIIAKIGVLAIIRTVFFTVGAQNIAGTWVQTTLLILSLLTVLMGSMMAYLEKVFKKRLAYSTVSQISYVLVGLFLFTGAGVEGALWQILFHAVVKVGLFLCAGAVIFLYGKTNVEQLHGLGKKMPVTFVCFTVLSLSLIGIPPTGGFFSKWYLASAALSNEGVGILSWLAPAILLVSALLTAAYLLSISIQAFWKPNDHDSEETAVAEPKRMTIPLMLLAAVAFFGGVFSQQIGEILSAVTRSIL